MGDVAVESSLTNVTPSKSAPFDTIPNIDSLEGTDIDGGDEYATLKRLQRHLEYVIYNPRASELLSSGNNPKQIHPASRRVH